MSLFNASQRLFQRSNSSFIANKLALTFSKLAFNLPSWRCLSIINKVAASVVGEVTQTLFFIAN